MSKLLVLTLSATDIKTAVKSDTYITGQVDKASDMVKNAARAFAEQAGNENYHEVKLFRTMKGSLAKMEAAIAEYVETSDDSAKISDTLTSSATSFTVSITVNDRASAAFATTLAYLAQEYIINTMLYYWWQPIDANLAKDYLAFSADNILDIRRCLSKSAPTASSTSYDDISGEVTPVSIFKKIYDVTLITSGEAYDNTPFFKVPLADFISSSEKRTVKMTTEQDMSSANMYLGNDTNHENWEDFASSHAIPATLTESEYNTLVSKKADYEYLFISAKSDNGTLTVSY